MATRETSASEHLLSNRSGIIHYIKRKNCSENHTPRYSRSKHTSKYYNAKQAVEVFRNQKLCFDPGTGYKYSTFGFSLLGSAIEGGSGTSYANWVRDTDQDTTWHVFLATGHRHAQGVRSARPYSEGQYSPAIQHGNCREVVGSPVFSTWPNSPTLYFRAVCSTIQAACGRPWLETLPMAMVSSTRLITARSGMKARMRIAEHCFTCIPGQPIVWALC